jgi:phosphoglycerate kinase
MLYYALSSISQKWYKKRILLRVDWNVSFNETGEINEFKIKASMKTIQWFLRQGSYVIIVTHWSRPLGFEYKYSTIHFIEILKRYGYNVVFIPTISLIESYLKSGGKIFLLENIRFLPHEKNCSQLLAKKLFSLVDIFIQDGFGILAKKACLTTVLPFLFEKKNRFIGFLIEEELTVLDSIRSADPSKNVLLIGGAKVPEKLMALQGGLSIASKILLLPPLVATYQAALGKNYGDSATIIYKELFPLVHEFVIQAQKKHVEIMVPIDFQIKTEQGLYEFVENEMVSKTDQIVGIGPKTVALYADAFRNATNLFMTGISGFISEKESWYTGSMLFNAIDVKTKRIVAGGDSVTLIQNIVGTSPYNSSFLTGGSASFYYLGSGNLVGLCPFKKEDITPKS